MRRWRGPTGLRDDAPSNTSTTQHHWREGPRRDRRALPWCRWAAAGPGRAHQNHKRRRCEGCRRVLPRCRWAAAGPGRASRRRAERSSQRGRLAGGPPPTGTHSGRARRRPEHPWGHKQPTQRKRAAAHRAAACSRSQWGTQRRREATTSATWTAFRAAPLRRLSPETTRTRPRLPSTAWS